MINKTIARTDFNQAKADYEKTEEHLKNIQNTGQIIGEVLKNMDDEKCINNNWFVDIIKLLNGPRYVVTCKKAIERERLKVGTRVALDFSTLTIMRILPREVDPVVHGMMVEGIYNINYLIRPWKSSIQRCWRIIKSDQRSKRMYRTSFN